MKSIDLVKISPEECSGIQMLGTSHCAAIQCKFQNTSACTGKNIIANGRNSKGYRIGVEGLLECDEMKTPDGDNVTAHPV